MKLKYKKEWDNWTRVYHKILKRLETMINIQRQVWDMMKIAGETNTTIMEIKKTVLKVSINNWTINTTNILGISEDLQYLIQRNMKDQVFQIQRMLADELNIYKRQGKSICGG